MRRESTSAERLLWRYLRKHQMEGMKFRRQEPILEYTADFVAHEKRLIIELDGGHHADQVEIDERRTRRLEQAGFQVLRFWNSDVLLNVEGVLETIRLAVAPSPQPSPRRGEGEDGSAAKARQC